MTVPSASALIDPFSFLHTGDLHLDTPFVGLSNAAPRAVSERLRVATLLAWDRIVGLALERRVDFVVVAGDVFEAETRTLMGQLAFASGLARLAKEGIATAVVTGNHDPLSGWEASVEWPPEAHRFPADEVGAFPIIRDGHEIARVYGISYGTRAERRDLAALFRRDPDVPFAIGLLHGTIGPSERHERYAPTTEEVLVSSGMDYWALGHIHSRRIVRIERPCVVYPGNPQGRDPGETEPRGVALVHVVANGTTRPEFVDTDVVRWTIVELDVSSITSMTRLQDSIHEALRGRRDEAGRSIVARVRLTGFAPLHDELRRPRVLEDLMAATREQYPPDADSFVWVESLRDQTRSQAETAYARGGDFIAELDALVEATMTSLGGEEVDRAVRLGAPASWGSQTFHGRNTLAGTGDLQALTLTNLAAELFEDGRVRRAAGEALTPTTDDLRVALDNARVLVLDRLRTTGEPR